MSDLDNLETATPVGRIAERLARREMLRRSGRWLGSLVLWEHLPGGSRESPVPAVFSARTSAVRATQAPATTTVSPVPHVTATANPAVNAGRWPARTVRTATGRARERRVTARSAPAPVFRHPDPTALNRRRR